MAGTALLCARQESNLRPFAPEANALSPELRAPEVANSSRSRAPRPTSGEAGPAGKDALLFSAMELRARVVELPLAERFTIARESQDVAEVVEVELRHGGMSGFGEAAPIARYDESAASALAWLESVELGDDPWALDEIARPTAAGGAGCQGRGRRSAPRPPGKADRPAGLAAARPATGRPSDLLDGLARRPRRHGAPGGGGRGARLPAPQAEGRRRATGSTSSASAPSVPPPSSRSRSTSTSSGRSTRPSRSCPQIEIEYCEQPLPAGDPDGPELKRQSPVPIYVDEDCHRLGDVAPCAERAHGITIKLAKAGGIREAVRMAHAARALGLGVMLGCMVESGLGIAAGAHIASLCDHVDLDGNLLLAARPVAGRRVRRRRAAPLRPAPGGSVVAARVGC